MHRYRVAGRVRSAARACLAARGVVSGAERRAPSVSRTSIGVMLVCIGALAAAVHAGPLTPPAGPIQPTDRVRLYTQPPAAFPIVISSPGSYVLMGELIATPGANGIEIAADGVTLDLNGFTLQGGGLGAKGIFITPPAGGFRRNIRIRNGVIEGWNSDGIDGTAAWDGRVEAVQLRRNLGTGLNVLDGWSVADCTASENGFEGFFVRNRCTIQGCGASLNGFGGFRTQDNCTLEDCIANGNSGSGFNCGSAIVLRGCASRDNATHGFELAARCALMDSVADFNSGNGVYSGPYCLVSRVSAAGNLANGIETFDHALVSDCNASFNSIRGIFINSGDVLNCTVRSNGDAGIDVFLSDSTVRGCSASENFGDGIRVTLLCTVADNHCTRNGTIVGGGFAAGIIASGDRNRIDNNHVSFNDYGVAAPTPGARNVIIRNTASGNGSDYGFIDPANDTGPFGPASASTSPWANINF